MKNIMLKDKSCMCFVDLERAFSRVLRKALEWATRKREMLEIFVRSMMNLYEGARRESLWILSFQRSLRSK